MSTRWRGVDYTSCFLMEAGFARQNETPVTVETAEGWANAKCPAAPGSPARIHSNELTRFSGLFEGLELAADVRMSGRTLYEDSLTAILHARWPDRFPA